MNELLQIRPEHNPQDITRIVRRACATSDLDKIEDAGYLVALALREAALEYNPCAPGTVESEAWDIGCCLAFVPDPGDADNDSDHGGSNGGGCSALPGFLQDRGFNTLHSANAADIMASREDDLMVMGVATLSCLALSFMLYA